MQVTLNATSSSVSVHRRRNSVLRRNDERRERNIMRLRRTIKLLCWIGAIFCICWLPLNILNAVMDSTTFFDGMTDEKFCGIYAVCHVLGMSSACANPVIYGFLNENFSKEFTAIGKWWANILETCMCSPCIRRLLTMRRRNVATNNCNNNNNGVTRINNTVNECVGDHQENNGLVIGPVGSPATMALSAVVAEGGNVELQPLNKKEIEANL